MAALSNDHEDANGQFEMNWEFDDALSTADKRFKFMTKSIAVKNMVLRQHLCRNPSKHSRGMAAYAHISAWDKE